VRPFSGTAKLLTVVALTAGLLGSAVSASAAPVLLYSATTTGLQDMVHQTAYTWQLNNVSVGNNTITGAVLTFFNFANWTTAAADPYNILWADLLDTSTSTHLTSDPQISSMSHSVDGQSTAQVDVLDGFRYSNAHVQSVVGPTGLVTAATAQTYLGSSTNAADGGVLGYNPAGSALGSNAGAFGTTPTTWTLTLTNTANQAVLTALTNYIANGNNIAIGLDADCHYSDTSIQFQIFGTPNVTGQAAVPEPATLLLVGSGIVAAYRRRRKQVAA
jgi:hypothetical protein